MTRGAAMPGARGHRETCTADSKPSDTSKYLPLPCSPRFHRCTGRGAPRGPVAACSTRLGAGRVAAADSKGQRQETRWTLGPTAAQLDTATGAQSSVSPRPTA